MFDAKCNEFDYGEIRITPNIADRVNEMHRRRAEEQASRNKQIATEAYKEKMQAISEAAQYRKANAELLCQLHAAMGWPNRAMLPAPTGASR